MLYFLEYIYNHVVVLHAQYDKQYFHILLLLLIIILLKIYEENMRY